MKNTMKKMMTVALAPALALSMNLAAFAANVNANGGKQEIDVRAKYESSSKTPTVYSVDVAWGAMEFTYAVSGTKTWNADTHTYSVNSNDGWTATGNEITVTNHSNTGIKADFTYAKAAGFDTVTGRFSQSSLTLPTAEGKALDDAVLTGKTALTLGGTLANDKTGLTKVGTVTVTVSKP